MGNGGLPTHGRGVWVWIGAVLLLLNGCGSGLAVVTGTVTLDGKPLPRGTVQFVPDPQRGNGGATGVGQIGADGRYEIWTTEARGAAVGHHLVGVVAREEVDLNQTSFARSLIPERYQDPLSSGLSVEVTAGKRNVIDLELSSN